MSSNQCTCGHEHAHGCPSRMPGDDYYCPLCRERFQEFSPWQKHIQKCIAWKPFAVHCMFLGCKFVTLKHDELDEHLAKHSDMPGHEGRVEASKQLRKTNDIKKAEQRKAGKAASAIKRRPNKITRKSQAERHAVALTDTMREEYRRIVKAMFPHLTSDLIARPGLAAPPLLPRVPRFTEEDVRTWDQDKREPFRNAWSWEADEAKLPFCMNQSDECNTQCVCRQGNPKVFDLRDYIDQHPAAIMYIAGFDYHAMDDDDPEGKTVGEVLGNILADNRDKIWAKTIHVLKKNCPYTWSNLKEVERERVETTGEFAIPIVVQFGNSPSLSSDIQELYFGGRHVIGRIPPTDHANIMARGFAWWTKDVLDAWSVHRWGLFAAKGTVFPPPLNLDQKLDLLVDDTIRRVAVNRRRLNNGFTRIVPQYMSFRRFNENSRAALERGPVPDKVNQVPSGTSPIPRFRVEDEHVVVRQLEWSVQEKRRQGKEVEVTSVSDLRNRYQELETVINVNAPFGNPYDRVTFSQIGADTVAGLRMRQNAGEPLAISMEGQDGMVDLPSKYTMDDSVWADISHWKEAVKGPYKGSEEDEYKWTAEELGRITAVISDRPKSRKRKRSRSPEVSDSERDDFTETGNSTGLDDDSEEDEEDALPDFTNL